VSERTEEVVAAELTEIGAAIQTIEDLQPGTLTPEQHGKLAEYRARWRLLYNERVAFAKQRNPREDELTYALAATCRCGAPMAYFLAESPRAWSCADILLGKFNDRLAKDVFQVEKVFFSKDPPGSEGKELHDVYPFAFWKVKSDPTRKKR